MTPRYTVSMLALNNLELTKRCIESVLRGGDDFELILTNNGSTDRTGEYFDDLSKRIPFVRVVHNSRNLGFQEPHKVALEMANAPLFVLLNNDTEVPPGWLEVMAEPFKNLNVALSGPGGACCSILPDFNGYPGRRFEYLEASCLMCRTETVRKHGLFADYLQFAYGEDSDLSLRMRRLGYQLARVDLRIKHRQGATSKFVPEIKEYQRRNHEVLKERWAHYLRVRHFDHPTIVKRSAALGDVLLITPIIEALHSQRPLSDIYVQTDWPTIIQGNPYVKGINPGIGQLKDCEIINLDMSYERMPSMHILDAYARTALVTLERRRLTYVVPDAAREYAKGYFEACMDCSKPTCVIHPGPTTWPGKNWPEDRFSAISTWLLFRGWNTVLIGGGQPRNRIECTLDLRGQTDIAHAAAYVGMSQLFVGLDSFPLHIAMSQGIPAVAVFGATLPEKILPEGPAIGVHADPLVYPCVGARHKVSGSTYVHCDGSCMRAVTIEMVKEAIEHMIGY